jgi:hypothetical protein
LHPANLRRLSISIAQCRAHASCLPIVIAITEQAFGLNDAAARADP